MHDCLILGGGVVGLSLAYELAGSGVRAAILERGAVAQEASWAGAGILPPGNIDEPRTADERLIRLCHDLHPLWSSRLLEETGVDNGYRRTGGLYLARNALAADLVRWQAAAWRSQGITAEELDPAQLQELEPTLATETAQNPVVTALFAPDEAQIRNPRHLRALRAACLARGVTIYEGEGAEEFVTNGSRVERVRTVTQDYAAGNICICGGAWSQGLLARLGVTVPLRPIRGQIALLAAEPRTLRHVVNEGRRYLVPRDDGRVLVGSTEEDAGFVKRTTAEAIGELLNFAIELVPKLATAPLETSWAGLRPATPDERPYLGKVPGYDNAFVAAGHFRSGLQLSPGTAVAMRQAILGQPVDFDLTAFRVDRPFEPSEAHDGR